MRKVLERPYLCNVCGEQYAQPQGVNRHYRAKHDPCSCIYCGAEWSRPYQYRDHIEKQHPDVDPNLVLGKVAGSRRKALIIGRDRPPAIKLDQRIQAVPLRLPLSPPAPKVTHDVPSTFSSIGKDAQPLNNVVDHASGLLPACPGESTAPDRSSRAVIAHIPTFPPLVSGYYGSPVVFDPITESYTPIHSLLPAMMRSGPTPSAPGLDPTETSIPAGVELGLIGAIEPYRYDSARGIAFRECELLDSSV